MKRLFIDLEICKKCEKCVIECSYYNHYPNNNGITSLREKVQYALICKQCEEAPCVEACPREALEKQEDGSLKRYNMLCIGCNSCVLACPFGTIYPELIPYLDSICDYCKKRFKDAYLCIETCPYGAVEFKEFEENKEKNILLINKNLGVHIKRWKL